MGPVSHAFCKECLTAKRQPWGTLVGCLVGCAKDGVADWARPYIEATCKFYNKTEDQLWEEVEQLGKDYDEHMRRRKQEQPCGG
jgi:hypothetical protein